MKQQQQQLQLQNMTDQINALGVNQIMAANPIIKTPTSQQLPVGSAIQDVTSSGVEYLDMTSGKRDIDEQNELEEALDASNASEVLRKKKIEQLLQNVGNVENPNPTYMETNKRNGRSVIKWRKSRY